MSNISNNSSIAQNTMFMYIRMLLILVVSLYTSRVVLHTLGQQDFGTYNIVCGVVILFTFINQAMSSGTQRHLSYEMGKKNGNISMIFSTCVNIHIGLALVVLLLAETIGVLFLNTQMYFPEGRMIAVNLCYQFSILSCLFGIIQVPFNALIIANERMSIYAYIGIVETILKLLVVYALTVSPIDKLVFYAFLLLLVSIFINIIYYIYFKRKLNFVKYIKVKNSALYKSLMSFSGWAFFGSVANVGLQQGISIIINIFYGVVLNAAVGIANQVNAQIISFVAGFQQAINPQLTKSEASGDKEKQFILICSSAKFSFMIMIFLAFPLLLNLDYILHLWLGQYPMHTETLCTAIIVGTLIETFSGPLWVTLYATGNIKEYQIIVSLVLLLNLPLSYYGGRMGMSPEFMYIIRNVIYCFAFATRLLFLKKLINFNVVGFIKYAVLPMLLVALLLFSTFFIPANISRASNFREFIIISVVAVVFESLILWSIGMNKKERQYLHQLILKRLTR